MLKRGAPCAVIALSRPLAGCSAHTNLVTRVAAENGKNGSKLRALLRLQQCRVATGLQELQQQWQVTSEPPGVAAAGFAGKSVAGVGIAMAGLCPAAGVSNRMSCSSTATCCR